MKEINLGRVIIDNRRKRGITQDELAEYMGVSKASVSKWETSSTYPDITILPRLAAFFDISIDELMDYRPQLAHEDIRKLYRQLSRDFSQKPFEEVLAHCRTLAQKYYACPPLLFQIGSLYVNHHMLAVSQEQRLGLLDEARNLFVRVREITDDTELASQAVGMEAYCMLLLGQPQEVLELLRPMEIIRLAPEPLLSSAFQMLGDTTAATRVLQTGIYKALLDMLNMLPAYMELCTRTADTEALEETCRRAFAVADTFCLDTLHPAMLLSLRITAAQCFARQGDMDNALSHLEYYTQTALHSTDSMKLRGDSYFNLLDNWLEETLILGRDFPRDSALIRQSITQAVTGNPIFAPLSDNPRFQTIVSRLQSGGEDTL